MMEEFTRTESALLEALERERALLRQRDVINGIIVHEMANALTVVNSTADLLRTTDAHSPLFQFSLMQLRGSVHLLNEMIRGLRILLDGVGDQPIFALGNLSEFVRNVVTDPVLVGENASGRVFFVDRGADLHLVFCSPLLRHALGNLVRNALKHGRTDSIVSVTVGTRGDRRWIHVRNRGPKIDAEIAAHLFEPGKKNTRGGMGLGLHITRACALRMGGQLVFGSTSIATVFSLLLPRRAANAEDNAPESPTAYFDYSGALRPANGQWANNVPRRAPPVANTPTAA